MEREIGLLRWACFIVTVALTVVAVVLAIQPEYLVVRFQEMLGVLPISQASGHFEDVYYSFTLSYFCVLIVLTLRLWRNPADHFHEIRSLLGLFLLPVLFSLRSLIGGQWGTFHIFVASYFGSLFIIVSVFKKRLHSVLAQKHVFRPIK